MNWKTKTLIVPINNMVVSAINCHCEPTADEIASLRSQ